MNNLLDKIKFSNYFDNRKKKLIFLIDTDVLWDIAKNKESKQVFDKLRDSGVVLVYSLASLFELGFGTSNNVDKQEIEFSKNLNELAVNENSMPTVQGMSSSLGDIYMNYIINNFYDNYKGKLLSLSPGVFNWNGAKDTLIKYMEYRQAKPVNAKKFQVDALINHSAWNITAFVWSNNVKDHLVLNYFMFKDFHKTKDRISELKMLAQRFSPIFNTNTLIQIINNKNINIYEEMLKHTSDKEIIEILNIAKEIYS